MSAHTAPSRFERSGSTVRFDNAGSPVTVTVCTSRIVRVELSDERDVAGPSYVGPRSWAGAPFEVLDGERMRLSTADLRIEAATDPVRLTFLDASGDWLLREPPRGGMLSQSCGDAGRRLHASFEFSGEQHFYGLGQGGRETRPARRCPPALEHAHRTRPGVGHGRAAARVQPRATRSSSTIRATRCCRWAAPTAGCGSPTPRKPGGWSGTSSSVATCVASCARWPSCSAAPPLPPRWALGFLQSTRHFDDTEELRRLPRTIREKRIPCDGLIYLSTLRRGPGLEPRGRASRLSADSLAGSGRPPRRGETAALRDHHARVPRAPRAVAALRRGRGARDTCSTTGYERASETSVGAPTIARASATSTSPTRPSAPGGGRPTRELVELGVAGWWLDGGEGPPAAAKLARAVTARCSTTSTTASATRPSPTARRPPAPISASSCSAARARRGCSGSERRAGPATSTTTSPTLEAQIPLGLNTGLSGVPYWGTDVGGFFHPVPETGELYARWFQLGAFSPDLPLARLGVARARALGPRRRSGDDLPRYAELRYRLLPYTYTLAWQAHTLGLPLMRPLVLNYPDDPRVWRLGHEFLWGDDLLVAPVTREGATAWPVYLPAGGWYDFWTRRAPRRARAASRSTRRSTGCRCSCAPAPSCRWGPVVQHTGERPLDEVTLLIYPDGASTLRALRGRRPVECVSPGPARAHTPRVRGRPRPASRSASASRSGRRSIVPASRRYLVRLRIDRRERRHRGGPGTTATTGRPGRRRRVLVAGRPRIHHDPSPHPANPHDHRHVEREIREPSSDEQGAFSTRGVIA